MTREEAINMLYGMRADNLNLDDAYTKDKYEALDMAIKALQQEPCEDAVSRQAVQDYIANYLSQYLYDDVRESVEVIDAYIGDLPSVNQQKIGHWIADVDKWGDVVTTVNGYRCDKCNTFNADKDNYCPNCGAKMIEPKESEE